MRRQKRVRDKIIDILLSGHWWHEMTYGIPIPETVNAWNCFQSLQNVIFVFSDWGVSSIFYCATDWQMLFMKIYYFPIQD